MAYKPEKIGRNRRRLFPKAAARASRDAKKASIRIARRAARLDPENAPTSRVIRGYID